MDKDLLKSIFESSDKADIPERMFSDYSKKPFETCLISSAPLHEVDFYIIQKIFNKRGECTLEMAASYDASKGMSKSYSEESLQSMQNFFMTRFNGNDDLDLCSFCDVGKFLQEDFMIGIWCQQGQYAKHPVTMCGSCQRELNEGLSKETKESDRGFKEKYFPGIPQDFDIFVPSIV